MSKDKFETIGRNIFEFRYDPIVSFYDWKGSLAEHLIEKLGFTGFRVTESRIDLANPDELNFSIFVTNNNAGFSFENNTDIGRFKEKVRAFLGGLDFKKFKPKRLVRIGTRWNFLQHKTNKTFLLVQDSFKDRVVRLDEGLYKDSSEELIDIGLPLHFKGEDYKFNIMHGPMKQKQALEMFFDNRRVYRDSSGNPKSMIPKNGLFFDIDVFTDEAQDFDFSLLENQAYKFIDVGAKKFNSFSAELFK